MRELTVADLHAEVGSELGVSDWVEVTQQRIAAFAAVSGDDQWVHLDTERAATTPFGTTIAHGMFTLSLGAALTRQIFTVIGVTVGVHYGYEKVRFPSPLPVGSRVRMRLKLEAVTETPASVRVSTTQTFEREGGERPVCVAEQIALLYSD